MDLEDNCKSHINKSVPISMKVSIMTNKTYAFTLLGYRYKFNF